MFKAGSAARNFLITIVVGGVVIGACLAALIPGVLALAQANTSVSGGVAPLRDLSQRSTVYDSAGNVIGILGTQNREQATLAEVPKIVQDAVISVEDRTFWTNDGIDLNGLVRAFVTNLTSGKIEQGGSTITQQLVKSRILSSSRDVNRKVKEIVLALRLNEKYSKNEILEQYLNTVYFGQGSYGIKSAAERFFLTVDPGQPFPRGKKLSELTIGEAALLAGVISNPEGNNPFVNPDGTKERRRLALASMVKGGYITEAEEAAGNAEPLPTVKPSAELRPTNSWTEEVQDQLYDAPMFSMLGATREQRKNAVLTGGLKIFATLDPAMQEDAQNAMDQVLPEKPGWTGSLVSMDPRTGAVKAMVAGPGFGESQYNIATSYPGRQAGSTWKVITLATAIENGYSPNDSIEGTSPCEFGALGRTQNAEGGGGTMTLRAATSGSVNCAFARLQQSVGSQKVIDTAKKLGISQDTLKPYLTLTLGVIESTALEMATVAATLANGGIRHDPIFVEKIIGPDGQVIFTAARNNPERRAISSAAAACTIDILRGVITGGTGTAARLNGRVSAGKTGTTDNRADANFIQMTPTLVDFVWHGNATARIPGAGFGGQIPARISKLFMDAALANQPAAEFPPAGPDCARAGAAITAAGRGGSASLNSTLPTLVPPSIVINPTTTSSTTTPPTTLPYCGPAGTPPTTIAAPCRPTP